MSSHALAEAVAHVVELVSDEDHRLAGLLDERGDRPGAAAVGVAVDVVRLVHDDEGVGPAALGERAALSRPRRRPVR